MLRYQITNKRSGERYEFTAADQATADQQIEANLASYGNSNRPSCFPKQSASSLADEAAFHEDKMQRIVRPYQPKHGQIII